MERARVKKNQDPETAGRGAGEESMATEETAEKARNWFARDGLIRETVSRKKDPTVDIEFAVHPDVLAIQSLTDRGLEWTDRYRDVITASYLIERHDETGDYITIHKIRVLDLAQRCKVTYALVGTRQELNWWYKFLKELEVDRKIFQMAQRRNAPGFGNPKALYAMHAFIPIDKRTERL